VIKSFRCDDTRTLFETGRARRFASISTVATRKLAMLDAAATLEFLRSPPGNRLEALKGDRKGQYSMRVNDQFRLCFRWTDEGPADVEIVDYH
jgi:toxin HigB-1